jgi:hypothetical protein
LGEGVIKMMWIHLRKERLLHPATIVASSVEALEMRGTLVWVRTEAQPAVAILTGLGRPIYYREGVDFGMNSTPTRIDDPIGRIANVCLDHWIQEIQGPGRACLN